MVEIPLDRQLTLRLTPMYLAKGVVHTVRDNATKLRLGYMEIPVQAKIAFGTNMIRLYVLGGPSAGIRVGTPDDLVSRFDRTFFRERHDQWGRFDAGVRGGGGIEVRGRRFAVALDVQYAYGLLDVYSGADFRDWTHGVHASVAVLSR